MCTQCHLRAASRQISAVLCPLTEFSGKVRAFNIQAGGGVDYDYLSPTVPAKLSLHACYGVTHSPRVSSSCEMNAGDDLLATHAGGIAPGSGRLLAHHFAAR